MFRARSLRLPECAGIRKGTYLEPLMLEVSADGRGERGFSF